MLQKAKNEIKRKSILENLIENENFFFEREIGRETICRRHRRIYMANRFNFYFILLRSSAFDFW